MRKTIKGKQYDTATAKRVGFIAADVPDSDPAYWRDELFMKRTGEFFLATVGGKASKYRKPWGLKDWVGSTAITPISAEDARVWVKEHLTEQDYSYYFGDE